MSTDSSDKNNPNQPDSWEKRIGLASTFLGIPAVEIEESLKSIGVKQEKAGLEYLSDEEVVLFGDIRKIFCDDKDIPIADVRMAMKHLRGPKNSKTVSSINPDALRLQERYGVELKLEHVPTDALLEDYDPTRPDNPITAVLKDRFGIRKVIVFKPLTKEVDIEATANYIADLDQGYGEEDLVESEGEMVRLHRVGEIPDQAVDEDPVFIGAPLKRGRSITGRYNWTDISIDCRQFIRLAVEAGEIDPDDRRDVREVLKIADSGIKALKEEFPEVAVTHREKNTLNKLPSLKMTMGQVSSYARTNTQNPFNINRNY